MNEFDAVGVPKISHSDVPTPEPGPGQLTLFSQEIHPVMLKLKNVNPNDLTPRQALDLLFELTQLEKESRDT